VTTDRPLNAKTPVLRRILFGVKRCGILDNRWSPRSFLLDSRRLRLVHPSKGEKESRGTFLVTSFEVRRRMGLRPDGLESHRLGVPIVAGSLFLEEVRGDIDRPEAYRGSDRLFDWALLIGEVYVFLIGIEKVFAGPKSCELDLELLDSSFLMRAFTRIMARLIAGIADRPVCTTRRSGCHRFPGVVVPRFIEARSPI
jgi:hypothetical protein